MDHASNAASAKDSLLDQDVACPSCEYNLRGLGLDDVVCPECGTRSNLPALLTRRWERPWYEAPGYTKLTLPVAWLVAAFFIWLVMLIFNQFASIGAALFNAGWALTALAVWLALLGWLWQTMGGGLALAYSLISHVALTVYILGLPLVIGGVALLFVGLADGMTAVESLLFIGMTLLGIGFFILGRVLERAIARYCILLYLQRSPR